METEKFMQLNKPQKIIVGLATIVPLISGSIIGLIGTIASYLADGDNLADRITRWELLHRDINDHIAAWVLIVLLLFYILYLFKSRHFRRDTRIMWTILFVLAGQEVLPVFWYFYVWRDKNFQFAAEKFTSHDPSHGLPQQ